MGSTYTVRADKEATRFWQVLLDRVASETDERLRANVEVVYKHVETEYLADVPGILSTLVEYPQYAYHGGPPGPKGRDQVTAHYTTAYKAGKRHIFELTRVLADRDAVMLEGIMHNGASGAQLLEDGLVAAGEVDPDTRYYAAREMLVVIPISDDGLMEGELVYMGDAVGELRPCTEAEQRYLGPVQP